MRLHTLADNIRKSSRYIYVTLYSNDQHITLRVHRDVVTRGDTHARDTHTQAMPPWLQHTLMSLRGNRELSPIHHATRCCDIYAATHRSLNDWDTHTQRPLTVAHVQKSGSGHLLQCRQLHKGTRRNTRQRVKVKRKKDVNTISPQRYCHARKYTCLRHAHTRYASLITAHIEEPGGKGALSPILD